MWESRYGFPVARPRSGGHRRYDADAVDRVARVLQDRKRGLSLKVAIERARDWVPSAPPSLFTALREHQPELAVLRLPVVAMRAISRAIEDECLSRAIRPVIAGAFQRERAYRRAEHRWRELGRTAGLAFVLADFPRRRTPRGAPAEVPLGTRSPLRREWAVACLDVNVSACLAGWEQPRVDGRRRFEAVWTTDPTAVSAALRVALQAAGRPIGARAEGLLDNLAAPLDGGSAPAVALANRAIAYLVEDRNPSLDAGPD
jgi:DNA-binding transcriptional MerR regulator